MMRMKKRRCKKRGWLRTRSRTRRRHEDQARGAGARSRRQEQARGAGARSRRRRTDDAPPQCTMKDTCALAIDEGDDGADDEAW